MILVTGGCGFVGRTLVPRLLKAGESVRILDALLFGSPFGSDVEVLEGDIRDAGAVDRAVAGAECVIHLAAAGSVADSVADPWGNFDVNVRGTLQVLESSRAADVARVVFASTGGALIGNAQPPVDESSLPWPISPYGASKLCGEGYCHAFAGSYGLSVTSLRFANVYGPHSAHKRGVVTNFIKNALRDRPLVIFGDGTATRDFLFVEDLVSGIVAAACRSDGGREQRRRDEVLHLASGRETATGELAELVVDLVGSRSAIEYRPKRPGEVERNFANAAKAVAELGFEARHDLNQGLAATIAWFAEQESDSP